MENSEQIEEQTVEPITIDVAPIATISIDVNGNWFFEYIGMTDKGVGTVLKTSTNLTQLFNQVRTTMHLNKEYFRQVAMRAAYVKKMQETEKKTEETTQTEE